MTDEVDEVGDEAEDERPVSVFQARVDHTLACVLTVETKEADVMLMAGLRMGWLAALREQLTAWAPNDADEARTRSLALLCVASAELDLDECLLTRRLLEAEDARRDMLPRRVTDQMLSALQGRRAKERREARDQAKRTQSDERLVSKLEDAARVLTGSEHGGGESLRVAAIIRGTSLELGCTDDLDPDLSLRLSFLSSLIRKRLGAITRDMRDFMNIAPHMSLPETQDALVELFDRERGVPPIAASHLERQGAHIFSLVTNPLLPEEVASDSVGTFLGTLMVMRSNLQSEGRELAVVRRIEAWGQARIETMIRRLARALTMHMRELIRESRALASSLSETLPSTQPAASEDAEFTLAEILVLARSIFEALCVAVESDPRSSESTRALGRLSGLSAYARMLPNEDDAHRTLSQLSHTAIEVWWGANLRGQTPISHADARRIALVYLNLEKPIERAKYAAMKGRRR